MTEKFIMYLGLNDKDTKRQEIQTLDAYKIAVNVIGDCSITEILGFYTHIDGEVVTEKSFKIEIFGHTELEVKIIAEKLKQMFNQESVIIEKQIVDSQFV